MGEREREARNRLSHWHTFFPPHIYLLFVSIAFIYIFYFMYTFADGYFYLLHCPSSFVVVIPDFYFLLPLIYVQKLFKWDFFSWMLKKIILPLKSMSERNLCYCVKPSFSFLSQSASSWNMIFVVLLLSSPVRRSVIIFNESWHYYVRCESVSIMVIGNKADYFVNLRTRFFLA